VLDPVFPLYRALYGLLLLHSGRVEDAVTKLEAFAEIDATSG
jgi:hypothetical protein